MPANPIALQQQDIMQAIDQPGQSGMPSARALRELFVDLWTRCSEASLRASAIATYPEVKASANALQMARNIWEICEVESIYRRMHVTLNQFQAEEDREVDRLRKRCADLAAENTRLRRCASRSA